MRSAEGGAVQLGELLRINQDGGKTSLEFLHWGSPQRLRWVAVFAWTCLNEKSKRKIGKGRYESGSKVDNLQTLTSLGASADQLDLCEKMNLITRLKLPAASTHDEQSGEFIDWPQFYLLEWFAGLHLAEMSDDTVRQSIQDLIAADIRNITVLRYARSIADRIQADSLAVIQRAIKAAEVKQSSAAPSTSTASPSRRM